MYFSDPAPVKKKSAGIYSPADSILFTLIELLIVITIIAILAAILLPALNIAKMKASSLTCLNKQKELAIAEAFYIEDNKEWLPPAYDNQLEQKFWRGMLSRYIKIPAGDQDTKIMCPAYPEDKIVRIGCNRNMGWISNGTPVSTNWIYRKLSRIKRPSGIVLSADALQYVFDATIRKYPHPVSVSYTTNPHQGMTNVSFVAGHVSSLDYNYVLQNRNSLLRDFYK